MGGQESSASVFPPVNGKKHGFLARPPILEEKRILSSKVKKVFP